MKDIELMLLAIKQSKVKFPYDEKDEFLLKLESILEIAKDIRNKQSTVQWNKKGKNA